MSAVLASIDQFLTQYNEEHNRPLIIYTAAQTSSPTTSAMFDKPWERLNTAERMNRLMQFHRHMTSMHHLSKKEATSLHQLFMKNAEKRLADSTQVTYDPRTERIVSMKGLKKEPGSAMFYFEETAFKPHGITLNVDFSALTVK